jgi:hypothetical protein
MPEKESVAQWWKRGPEGAKIVIVVIMALLLLDWLEDFFRIGLW